jgi:hypothetical protein
MNCLFEIQRSQFQRCFQQFQKCWTHCIDREGATFKGTVVTNNKGNDVFHYQLRQPNYGYTFIYYITFWLQHESLLAREDITFELLVQKNK